MKLNKNEKNYWRKIQKIQALQDNNNGGKLFFIKQSILTEINEYFNFKSQDGLLTLFLKREHKKENKNRNGFNEKIM